MSRNQRVKDALRAKGISQEKLAARLNVSQAAVAKQLNKTEDIDSIQFLSAVTELTSFTFEWLLFGSNVPKTKDELEGMYESRVSDTVRNASTVSEDYQLAHVSEPGTELVSSDGESLKSKAVRRLIVPVDVNKNELITYVPAKEQGRYQSAFSDPEFIRKLPAFSLPILINQTAHHRMFEVDGNSMRQPGSRGLNDGDVVIASYVEDIYNLKDGHVYVVVTAKGIMIKRVTYRLNDDANRVIILNSDNKNSAYEPIVVHAAEIIEVWEFKAFISKQLSYSSDLWDIINDLSAKQAIMENQLKQMKESKK